MESINKPMPAEVAALQRRSIRRRHDTRDDHLVFVSTGRCVSLHFIVQLRSLRCTASYSVESISHVHVALASHASCSRAELLTAGLGRRARGYTCNTTLERYDGLLLDAGHVLVGSLAVCVGRELTALVKQRVLLVRSCVDLEA